MSNTPDSGTTSSPPPSPTPAPSDPPTAPATASATTTANGDTSPTKVLNSEVTMVTADVHITESILDDPITIDSYLSEDILRDSSPPNSPHEVNMEIDISDIEAEA